MNILEHDPSTVLNTFFDSFISQIKTFSTTDGNRNQFIGSFLTKLFNFEAGIKSWST